MEASQRYLLWFWCRDRGCETGRGTKEETAKDQSVLIKFFLGNIHFITFFKWHDFFCFLCLAYIKRVIAHPSFHNINFKQAEKMMESMDQGDVVIRPSSKGENHLTVTWKVADGIYQHVDIREEGKENAFSLGHTLWINNEVSCCCMSHIGLWRSP